MSSSNISKSKLITSSAIPTDDYSNFDHSQITYINLQSIPLIVDETGNIVIEKYETLEERYREGESRIIW